MESNLVLLATTSVVKVNLTMNELKQDLTRFLDLAVKHLNLDPRLWTIEVEQNNVVLQTDDAIQADMLAVFQLEVVCKMTSLGYWWNLNR